MLQIMTPAQSTALTTYAAVAAEIGNVDDTLVGEMILRASATIETVCGRSFAQERVQETNPSVLRRGGSIVLRRWPVVAIHSVTSDGHAVDPADYAEDHGVITGAFGRVSIDYTAGYVLPGEDGRTLPHDIERVCIELVKNDWHTRNRDASIRSEDVDGVSSLAFFGSGSTMNAITAPLAPYRMPVAL